MSHFVIQGGKRLSGTYTPSGNKNAVLPMLAAATLTDEPVVLRNVPLIKDVHTMLQILEYLGADVELRGHTVTIRAGKIRRRKLPADLCHRVRSSILFAGPLCARYSRAILSPPGGDGIGRRPLDTHFSGLRALGIDVRGDQVYRFECKKLKGADIVLDEASVTATENILMAAVIAAGRTTIYNAACEPHVQDLCLMLNKMGARIRGIGTNYLTVDGVTSMGGVSHRVCADHIEIASFIAASAVTGGDLTVSGVDAGTLTAIERGFHKLGVRWQIDRQTLHLPPAQKLRVENDHGSAVPKIEDGVWPHFPSDLMSVATVVATQAKGTVLFFEKMFESRMYFVDHLINMGARIVQCDPHRVMVMGPSRLRATRLPSPDIRAGMTMVVAALCARGQSVIGNADIIDRGYEAVEVKLRRLGADITRVADG